MGFNDDREYQKLIKFIGYLVSIIWAASMIVDVLLDDWAPDEFVHWIMAAIVGALYGRNILKRVNDD